MKITPTSHLKQKWMLLGALALTASLSYVAVWFVSATSNRTPRELQAAAQRGDVEHGTLYVTNQNGSIAAIHYWRPLGSNAQDVVFEPQGDRILARAVPKGNRGS